MKVIIFTFLSTILLTHLITCFKGASEGAAAAGGGQVVDPWTVESDNAIDYDKLIRDFGSQPLTQDIIDRMEKLTGKKPHRFLRLFIH